MPVSDNPSAGSASELFPIVAKPGIQRDGTEFDSDTWVDGQHVRFQRGRPKKMGGYREITNQFDGPIRQVLMHSRAGNNRAYCGSGSNLQFTDLTADGIGGGVVDITPILGDGFIPSNYNTWQFAELYDSGSTSSKLLAHAAPNLRSIDSTTNRKIWMGDDDGIIPLIVAGDAPEVSGGICDIAPYVFAFGNDGAVFWPVANTPDDWSSTGSGAVRVTKSKIVYGHAVRGGAGQSPAALLISTDSVLRSTFAGGAAVFDFDTLSSQSSILSSAGVIEYDGLFFWPGADRFLMYNGIVQEVPNNMNINYFYDGLTRAHAQKVWATKVTRFGEIWWFYPRDGATECNAALIFNIRENTWYDTSMKRSAGYFPQVFPFPVWADVDPSETGLVRPSSGTAATSAAGTPGNAFDGNPTTNCTQTSTNGNISYDFGVDTTKTIARVGITSNGNHTFNLVFEYSDANAATWTTAIAPGAVAYSDDVPTFYDLPTPIAARAWRVRITGGGTLDVSEVYFLSKGYMLMQHEIGKDRVVGGQTLAIDSYIETNSIDYVSKGPMGDRWMGMNRQVILDRIEPDLIQSGPMTVTVRTKRFARDDHSDQDFPMTEGSGAADMDGLKMDLTQQGRLVSLRFQSNTAGGFYEMGEIMIKLSDGPE